MNNSNTQAKLKLKGYKFSNIRLEILNFLENSSKPISVPEISFLMTQNNLKPNKTTIYRELDILIKEGLITELDILDGKKRYELQKEIGHHHHLICESCKTIECISVPGDLHKIEENIESKFGFQIQKHVLEFFGLCKNCQLKTN